MKSSRIDFAQASLRRLVAGVQPLTWLLLAVGVSACVTALWHGLVLQQRLALVQNSVRQADALLATHLPARPIQRVPTISVAHANAVNAAVRRLNVPWSALLDALEDATPPNIALVAFEPDPQKRVLKAEAEARSPEDMIAYVEALKRQGAFRMLRFSQHETSLQEPGRPIRFQFEARWDEPAS